MSNDYGNLPNVLNVTPVVFARMAGQQNSPVVGDHVKFDTISYDSGSGLISVDISSPYTTGAGASIGRITLEGGHVYELLFNPNNMTWSATNGYLDFQFYDVTNGVLLGTAFDFTPFNDAATDHNGAVANLIFAPPSRTIIEVQVTTSINVARVGYSSYNALIIIKALS